MGGDAGARENVALVLVLAEIVGDDGPFETARRNHRQFALEGDEPFEDHRPGAKRAMHGAEIGPLAQHRLPLAVVAEAAGFQDRRAADLAHRAQQRPGVRHVGERRRLQPEPAQKALFRQPVLGHGQSMGAGPYRHTLRQMGDGMSGQVFELEGHRIADLGELRNLSVALRAAIFARLFEQIY